MYPQWYRQMLSDALIELHFTFTHYAILNKNSGKAHSDVYVPELYSIESFEETSPCHCFSLQTQNLDYRSYGPTKKTKRLS
jgi:hypothetical protein